MSRAERKDVGVKRRPYFLVTNAILLAVSTLIGLRILPAPDTVGLLLAFWTLFLLPGFLLSRLILGASGVTLEGTATAVAIGLAVPVAASVAAFAPGIGFGGVAAGLSAAVLVLLFLGRRAGEGHGDDGAELVGSFAGRIPRSGRDRALRLLLVVLVFAACAVFFFGPPQW